MNVGLAGHTRHEIRADEGPQNDRALAGRQSLAGITVKVDRNQHDRHLQQKQTNQRYRRQRRKRLVDGITCARLL